MRIATRVVMVALGAALVLAGSSGAAERAGTFTDATGDQQGTAPDVTTVTAENDRAGKITMSIRVANQATLAADSEIFVLIDSDRSEATGAPDSLGADFFFYIDGSDRTWGLGKWNGSEFDYDTPSDTVQAAYSGGLATFTINRSELGGTRGFNFWIRGIQHTGPQTSAIDDAPNEGVYTYALTATGHRLGSIIIRTNPPPVAGRTFKIAVLYVDVIGENLHAVPTKYTCRAKIGGKSIRGSGKGGCTWKVPRSARGKTFVVTVSCFWDGATNSKTWRWRVV
jgi:hypothetical protein